ncbi:uncharacterized protein LOC6552428 [Drosophila erecta]|uniref:GG16993 n=1 Tax=Drosophila erecta TaxID=7220 RepID=B3NZN1_DROER|nr:uncharacterized protein LOC6552428 [Drosophila erecta]XP_026831621.1 uncharacterized protein LOC6552428 [Drosophila erecta]EDV49741.1 uncharacterized protein Dere_GG16993 [Drosophila erecta]
MMKATAWFCPVLLTLLCATRLVCTAQRGAAAAGGAAGGSGAAAGGAELGGSGRTNGYPLDYPDGTRNTQDDFLLAKRNKPSLSIVNPLDVLRQRLLLEIARRQMKENSRQVELNRAILKNVGKRFMLRGGGVGGVGGSGAGGLAPKVSRRYRQQWPLERELEQERQKDAVPEEQLYRQQLLPWKHFPSQLWSYGWTQSPYKESSQFVDSQQSASTGPQSQALPKQLQLQLLSYAKKPLDVAGMGLARHRVSGNEANETNHENDDGNGASKNTARYVDDDDEGEDSYNDLGAEGVGQGLRLGMGLGLGLERFEVMEDKPNWANEEPNEVMMVNANERVPWSFPYRFHKSQHNVN